MEQVPASGRSSCVRLLAALLVLVGCGREASTSPNPLPPVQREPGPGAPDQGPEQDRAACPDSIDQLAGPAWLQSDDDRLDGHRFRVILKSARRLMTFSGGSRQLGDPKAGCYPIALGYDGRTGPKTEEGDRRTPEGWYRSSDKPTSRFPGAIAIHYPNAADAARALREQRIGSNHYNRILRNLRAARKPPQSTPLGGEILIHGGGSVQDWTLGCVALEDDDLDAVRATGPEDQEGWVLILP